MERCAFAALGFVLLAAAPASRLDAPYVHPQRLVDVGGRRLNIYCSGSGGPTVILDGAIGESSYVWHLVQPRLARSVRVCSYDRAGYGFSDPGGLPHTTDSNVEDLHRLLEAAHVRAPYIVVAHSLNAFDARVFADRYRGEVAGLVLLDPSDVEEDQFASIYGKKHEDAEQAADLKFLEMCDSMARNHRLKSGDDCVGASRAGESPQFARVQLAHLESAPLWDAVLSEMRSLPADLREVTNEQRQYGDLPLIVVTAGEAEGQGAKAEGATDAQIRAANRLRNHMREADAELSAHGINCTIAGASHYLQLERPDVVVNATLEVVRDSQTGKRPSCSPL